MLLKFRGFIPKKPNIVNFYIFLCVQKKTGGESLEKHVSLLEVKGYGHDLHGIRKKFRR